MAFLLMYKISLYHISYCLFYYQDQTSNITCWMFIWNRVYEKQVL